MSGRFYIRILLLALHIFLCICSAYCVLTADLASMDRSTEFNIGCDLLVLIIASCIYSSSILDRRVDRGIFIFFMLITLEAVLLTCDIMGWILIGNPDMVFWNLASSYAIYSLMTIMTLVFWYYLLFRLGESRMNPSRFTPLMLVVAAISLLIIASNLFTDSLFYVDDGGWYHRSDTFFLSLVAPSVMAVILLYVILASEETLRHKASYLAYVIIPYAATMLQVYMFGISLQYVSFMIALVVMYANIYIGRSLELEGTNADMLELRMDAMVSQVRPHFLYNALTSIMAIKGCSEETREAIVDFSRYLRFNLDSTKSPESVPVEKEVEHVETFINLRNLHYRGHLHFVEQVDDRDLLLPPQTLKVIAENMIEGHVPDDIDVRLTIEVFREEGMHQVTISRDHPDEELERMVASGGNEEISSVIDRLDRIMGCRQRYESYPGESITLVLDIPVGGGTGGA